MKTIASAARLLMAAALIQANTTLFAQSTDAKPDVQKYRLYIVKEDNGDKEVTDKTFSSKSELDKYIKENNIGAPEAKLEEPPAPTTPPTAPVASEAPSQSAKQKGKKTVPENKKEKKIIIIEKTEGSTGDSKFEIDLSQLSPDDASKVIQEVINMNIAKVEVVHIDKNSKGSISPESGDMNQERGPRLNIDVPGGSASANLGDLRVYPNPGSQFHVACNVNKPANVKLSMVDIQGHQVYETDMNNVSGKIEKDIDAARFSRGTYLMSIEAGSERATTTVVLQ